MEEKIQNTSREKFVRNESHQDISLVGKDVTELKASTIAAINQYLDSENQGYDKDYQNDEEIHRGR